MGYVSAGLLICTALLGGMFDGHTVDWQDASHGQTIP